MSEVRCPNCNRLLFRGIIKYVEIKCPKCHCVQCFQERMQEDKNFNMHVMHNMLESH